MQSNCYIPGIQLRLVVIGAILSLVTIARLYNNHLINRDIQKLNDLEQSYEVVLNKTDEHIINYFSVSQPHTEYFEILITKIDSLNNSLLIDDSHSIYLIDTLCKLFYSLPTELIKLPPFNKIPFNINSYKFNNLNGGKVAAELIHKFLLQKVESNPFYFRENKNILRKIFQLSKILIYKHMLGVSTDCFAVYHSVLLKSSPIYSDSIDIYISELRAGNQTNSTQSIEFIWDEKEIKLDLGYMNSSFCNLEIDSTQFVNHFKISSSSSR